MLDKLLKREKPEELAKRWRRQLNTEMRKIDMQITKIRREEMKVKQAARQAAQKGDSVAVRMLSKEIIHSRHAVRRMYTARTHMNSVAMHLQQQVSQIKLAGHMKNSADIIQHMNRLVRVGEVQQTMQSLCKEMTKAGLIEEMMNDTIDNALDEDISDTELEEEVSKVVEEVMHGQMGGVTVGRAELPESQKEQQLMSNEDDEDDLLERYNALRGNAN